MEARLEEAATEVKATMMATRNKNKFEVPDGLGMMAAKCKNPVLSEVLRKKAHENDARAGALLGGKIVRRSVVQKLWINERASEDRAEQKEECRANCERYHDDKDETTKVQAERIREQRRKGDSLFALSGRKIDTTVDRVIRARGENDEE